MTIARHLKRVSLALPVLGTFGLMQSAFAIGTDAGVSIDNRASVNYSVGGVAQTQINSSPTGNSTPGAGGGANTSFVVDSRILHIVSEVGSAASSTTPGATNVVATFLVTNQSNGTQGYRLTATNGANGGASPFAGGSNDNTDVNNLRVFVDANNNGTYEAGTDTATAINSLAEDANVRVFVLADVPLTATNDQYANVQLAAAAAVVGSNGATLLVQSAGADNPAVVDIVFADTGLTARDGVHEASDQYAIASAALSVQKLSSVFSDPFNNTTNPKAIPGAVVQYAITVTNNGAAQATGVRINDLLPSDTTFASGQYAGGTDVEVQVGAAAPTRCIAETPADTNADGCFRNPAGELVVQSPMAIGTVNTGAASAVTVRFRVTIN